MKELITTESDRELLLHFSRDRSGTSDGESGCIRVRVLSAETELFDVDFSESIECPNFLGSSLVWKGWNERQITKKEALRLGHELWRALPVVAQARIHSELSLNIRFLLKISSDSKRVQQLPWEWLSADGYSFLALGPCIRIVRCVPIRFSSPPITVVNPIKLLLVVSNPKDESVLYAPSELQAITYNMNYSLYQSTTVNEPKLEVLRDSLTMAPSIIHYVGHSGMSKGEGNLILHNTDDSTLWISGADLSTELPLTVRLLCLSTCFTAENYNINGLSRFAFSNADLNLPSMIVNRSRPTNQGVSDFWSEFYSQLNGNGGNLVDAVHSARCSTEARAGQLDLSWSSFALVLRGQTSKIFNIVDSEDNSKMAQELILQMASFSANEYASWIRSVAPQSQTTDKKLRFKRELEQKSLELSEMWNQLNKVN